MASVAIGPGDVLIVTDVQNDFILGGALAVPGGDEIVPIINRLAGRFSHTVLTQDWHPADHVSFATQHPGRKPFDRIALGYGEQVLWPDHCVQGTTGADFSEGLSIPRAELIIRKGYNRLVDSYSVFCEADGRTRTGLAGYLRERGFSRCFLAGLATDFCVAWSALDARREGFAAVVIADACRAIDAEGSLAKAWADMNRAGVTRVRSTDLQ